MSGENFYAAKPVYRGGKDATIQGFIGLSKRLGLTRFGIDVVIDTTRDSYEMLLFATEDFGLPSQVEKYEKFTNSENGIPGSCGTLRSWDSSEYWDSSDNVAVLRKYMERLEERIRMDLGPEVVVRRTVRPQILALYTEMSQSVK